MKHIRLYEEDDDQDSFEKYGFEYAGKWVYFKIDTEGSLEKLKIAVEKTGYSDLFYKTYELDMDDKDYTPKFTTFYLVFNPTNEYPGRSQCAIKITLDEFIDKYQEIKYLGEISVDDHELSAKKYNI